MNPVYKNTWLSVFNADALDVMAHLAAENVAVDAIVTDPPYSSGGAMRSDRTRPVGAKYSNAIIKPLPTFQGDNRDQRSYLLWSYLWTSAARQIARPSASLFSFIDWRQMPTMSDALQLSGWVWQGMGVWDKGFGRPNRGKFTAGHELVLHGTNGPNQQIERYARGVFGHPTPRAKQHLSEKPVPVMSWILSLLDDGACILDPFAGSGSTLLAARERGMQVIAVESDPQHIETIIQRCS